MIAISYRREDSLPMAGRLYDRLRTEFGQSNVFMDFDSIPYGVDFRDHIKKMIDRSQLVIAMIGPDWFGGRGKRRRIDDSTDFVRLEIAYALERNVPVIPVLIGNTRMPKPEQLPKEIEGLAFRNALSLDAGIDFHHHADRLIAGINRLMIASAPPVVQKPRMPAIPLEIQKPAQPTVSKESPSEPLSLKPAVEPPEPKPAPPSAETPRAPPEWTESLSPAPGALFQGPERLERPAQHPKSPPVETLKPIAHVAPPGPPRETKVSSPSAPTVSKKSPPPALPPKPTVDVANLKSEPSRAETSKTPGDQLRTIPARVPPATLAPKSAPVESHKPVARAAPSELQRKIEVSSPGSMSLTPGWGARSGMSIARLKERIMGKSEHQRKNEVSSPSSASLTLGWVARMQRAIARLQDRAMADYVQPFDATRLRKSLVNLWRRKELTVFAAILVVGGLLSSIWFIAIRPDIRRSEALHRPGVEPSQKELVPNNPVTPPTASAIPSPSPSPELPLQQITPAGTDGSYSSTDASSNSSVSAPSPTATAEGGRNNRPWRTWIGDFVRQFVSTNQSQDVDIDLAFYAPIVDYFDDKEKDHEFLRQDLERYNARWPVRRDSIEGDIHLSEKIPDQEYSANFKQNFYAESAARAIWSEGQSMVDVDIRILDGVPKIVGIKTKTLRQHKGKPAASSNSQGQRVLEPHQLGAANTSVKITMPNRPKDKQGRYLAGSGVLLAQVDPKTGDVISVRMLESTGQRALDEFALKQAPGWKVKPGTPSPVRIPITFADETPGAESAKPH